RIRAEEERKAALDARGDEPHRERLVPGYVAVRAGRQLGRLDLVLRGERLGGLAERIPGLEGADVRLGDLRLRRELLFEERDRPLGRTREQPGHEPPREHVLRA